MGNNCLFCTWLHGNGDRTIYDNITDTVKDPSGFEDDDLPDGKRPNAENIYIENAPIEVSGALDKGRKVSIDDFMLLKAIVPRAIAKLKGAGGASFCLIYLINRLYLKVLGKGSFGKVMLVEKKDNKRLFAMKILKKEAIAKRNQTKHTQSEREIMENIKCPFLVQLYYAFQTPSKLYLVMDFLQGGELFFHLRRSYKFNEQRAKIYVAEIVLALEYLHQKNIIYRDLKPENILLDDSGHIKITDFGLSKAGLEYNEKTYTFCGTPEYLAPEILLGKGHDKSVDWWSLGALLYEMINGSPPFYSRDRKKMFKNILEKPIEMKSYFSPEASSILQGLLTVDPKKRLGSSSADALEIKQHPFFKDIDWELLLQKKIDPPFRPKITNDKDLRHFDKVFTNESVRETPAYHNIGKTYSDHYPNFTYGSQKNMNMNESLEIQIEENDQGQTEADQNDSRNMKKY